MLFQLSWKLKVKHLETFFLTLLIAINFFVCFSLSAVLLIADVGLLRKLNCHCWPDEHKKCPVDILYHIFMNKSNNNMLIAVCSKKNSCLLLWSCSYGRLEMSLWQSYFFWQALMPPKLMLMGIQHFTCASRPILFCRI